MQRLLLRTFCFLFIFFLIVLYNVTPVIAQMKSDGSFSKLLLVGHNKEGSKLGDLYQQEQTPFKLKSENAALRWSLFGTLIPVAAGVAIWILDKHESVPNYDPWGNIHYQDKEPNRAIPVTLILSGIFIGPSIGYFYAGESDRGLDGIGIRMVIALGTTALFGTILAKGTDTSGELGGLRIIGAWALAAVIGSGLTIGHSIYDIAKVKSTVRKHNLALQKTTLILTPRYFVDSKACGVGLQIRF